MKLILAKKILQALTLFLLINPLSFAEDSIMATGQTRDPFAKRITQASDSKDLNLSLAEYPLSALRLTGILQLGTASWVIFRDPRGRLHQLKTGDALGLEQAKITAIFADKIVLVSQHNLPANQPSVTTVLNLP